MPKPTHVRSFEKFLETDRNEIRNYIAFGLFMQSENDWVANRSRTPTDDDYKNYHDTLLTPLELRRYREAADVVLTDFANKAVNSGHTKLLADSLRQYRTDLQQHGTNTANHHQAFRRNGVREAIWGAFWWTIILIVFSFILAFANIDPFEYYRKANSLFHHSAEK
jgi:hypothetical protein